MSAIGLHFEGVSFFECNIIIMDNYGVIGREFHGKEISLISFNQSDKQCSFLSIRVTNNTV